jgi:hypothetical protein
MFGADKTGQNRCTSHAAIDENEAKISTQAKPAVYQIRISGHLDGKWTGYFEGFSISLEECGDTFLTGPVIDQALLHGLFKQIRDLGLVLISVNVVNKP